MSDEIKPWQHLDSEMLFKHQRMSLAEDRILLPNGEERHWLRMDGHPDWVEIVAVNDEGKILVARQYCHPSRQIVHEFPGGTFEDGEDSAETARRELEEEVGLIAGKLTFLGRHLANNRRSDHHGHIYLATDLTQGTASPEPEEHILWDWFDSAEIDASILSGKFDSVTLLASWMYFKLSEPKLRADGILP